MAELLKKLALSLIKSQLSSPAVRSELHTYVDAQVDSELDKLVAQYSSAPGLEGIIVQAAGAELKDPTVRAQLHALIDQEADALIDLLVSKIA